MPPPLRYTPSQLRQAATSTTGEVREMLTYAADLSEYVRRPGTQKLEIGTLLSSRTHEGRVELSIDEHTTQMDLDKAREVFGMLAAAIEAAISDQLMYQFLTERVHLDDEAAVRALSDFREMRQGSRGTVYPS